MPTDRTPAIPELELDGLSEAVLLDRISELEKDSPRLVQVRVTSARINMIQQAVCALRASGISAMVSVSNTAGGDLGDLRQSLQTLFDCDQLSLRNLIAILGAHLPPEAVNILETEAKVENLWMREWLSATEDPRVAKVPPLPWRSFIRKITGENLRFANTVIELLDGKSDEFESSLAGVLRTFVIEKKKVICMFPKRGANA